MSLKLTILGFNSATPRRDSAATSQYLEIRNHHFLIDCGEGTQIQLRKAKIKFSSINHIFISHLHGDHVFGLIGFISTLQLLGREKPIWIYGPQGIKDFIMNQLKHTEARCSFEINFHELNQKVSEKIFEDDKVEVHTIPLDHRIYCNGYLFKEKPRLRNLNIEAVKQHPEIEVCDYENLRHGRDFVMEDGSIISNNELTFDPKCPLSYAFCSDTRYKPDIVPIIQGVDLLYHESTFLSDLQEMADYTGHSTAREAALIAKEANVRKLILGHFSNRYHDLSVMLDEARPIFENVVIPKQLETFEIDCKPEPAL